MTIFNYTVNYIDVIIVALMLIMTCFGYKRGMLLTVVNFIRYSVGFFLCFFVSNNYSSVIYNNYVKQKCIDYVDNKIDFTENIDVVIDNIKAFVLQLPTAIQNSVDTSVFDNATEDNAKELLLNNVIQPVALFAVKAVLFLAVFVVFFVITGIIIRVIRKKSKGNNSPLRVANRLAGGVFGFFKGLVLIFAISCTFSYIFGLNDNIQNENSFFKEISSSSLYALINDYNPFNTVSRGLL